MVFLEKVNILNITIEEIEYLVVISCKLRIKEMRINNKCTSIVYSRYTNLPCPILRLNKPLFLFYRQIRQYVIESCCTLWTTKYIQ